MCLCIPEHTPKIVYSSIIQPNTGIDGRVDKPRVGYSIARSRNIDESHIEQKSTTVWFYSYETKTGKTTIFFSDYKTYFLSPPPPSFGG